MRKLTSFTFITLNGFYKGLNEDISWHKHGGEASKFADKSSASDNILVFGRKTYEMMYSFWPTALAAKQFPTVAENMNKAAKIVFSKSLKKADWNNTTLINGDIVEQMKKMKRTKGNDMTILGSGSLIAQFSDAGLIDEYLLMVDPLAIGQGTSIFTGIQKQLNLKLKSTKTFKKEGILLLTYENLR